MVIAAYETGITNFEQLEALHNAQMKAQMHSFHTRFDTHVVTTDEGFAVYAEDDFDNLPEAMIDAIVYTAQSQFDYAV